MGNRHVNVIVQSNSLGLTGPGTAEPAILSHNVTFPERVRRYSSLAGFITDHPGTGTPEYRAMERMFQQKPKPRRVAVLRAANKPTQRYLVEMLVARTNHTYKAKVIGDGVTETDIALKTFTNMVFTAVNATEECTSVAHGLSTGDGPFRVSNSGGGLPGGLAIDTNYWIIKVSADVFKLATSKANADAGTAINLTSDGTGTHTLNTATNDVIMAGLVDRLNLVVGKNFTAVLIGSAGTFDTQVTADVAGKWFSIEVKARADLKITQNHADPGIAADLIAIKVEDNAWYGLYTLYNSNACVQAAAAWVEANDKVYFPDYCDSVVATEPIATADDTGEDLFDFAYERTHSDFHPSPANMCGAAALGRFLAHRPGGITMKWQPLAGVEPVALTETEENNLLAKRVNTFAPISGVGATWEGYAAKIGVFIDNVRNDDHVRFGMETRLSATLLANPIVTFDDDGIQLLAADVEGELQEAVRDKIYASYQFTPPKAADISADDKANRKLTGMVWTAVRAGAVHNVDPVTGSVTVE